MARDYDSKSQRPKIGARFNPYKRFCNLLIPDAMGRSRELNPGAKLVYGSLRRFAGKDGHCFPAVETLAREVGLGKRQVQKHLKALEREGFIRREERFKGRNQTSNSYVFLWHAIFEQDAPSKGDELQFTPSRASEFTHRMHGSSHKEGHSKEGQLQEEEADMSTRPPWIMEDGTVNMGDPRLYGLTSWNDKPSTRSRKRRRWEA
jgi:DNA-binding transcriptional MocR family regulator